MNILNVDTVRTILVLFGLPFIIWGVIFLVVITVFRLMWGIYYERKDRRKDDD